MRFIAVLFCFSLCYSVLEPLLATQPLTQEETEDEKKHKLLLRDLREAYNYYLEDEFEKAHKKYDKILETYPENLEAHIGKMNCFSSQKMSKELVAYGKKSTGLTKVSSLEHLILDGVTKFFEKDLQGSVEAFEKASEAFPKEAYLAEYYLGYLEYRGRKHDTALKHLQKALELNKDYADTYYLLGDIYFSKKEKQKVIDNWNTYLELGPKKGGRYDRVVKILKSYGGR